MENSNVYEKPVTLKNILKFAVPTIARSEERRVGKECRL